MSRLPIIIDCDPGIDDALALLVLYKYKAMFDIRLITSSAGNTPIDVTMNNVQFFAKNFFDGVEVGKGVGHALYKVNPDNAEDVHGLSGLGEYSVPKQQASSNDDGIGCMYRIIKSSAEPITIVALGPLTNVGKLLLDYPDVKDNIKQIYTMIGSINGIGNIKPYAEFNAYFDPDAFKIVADSGIPMLINPMELGHNSRLPKTIFIDREIGNDIQHMITSMIRGLYEFRDPNLVSLFDVHTAFALVHPEYYDFVPCDVLVTLDGKCDGKCVLTNNSNSNNYYQVIKDLDECNSAIIKDLFEIK